MYKSEREHLKEDELIIQGLEKQIEKQRLYILTLTNDFVKLDRELEAAKREIERLKNGRNV